MKKEQCIQKVTILMLWFMIIGMKLLNKFLIRFFLDIKTARNSRLKTAIWTFDYRDVKLFDYNCHKINLAYLGWIKKKKVNENHKNDDYICFQYAATFALNFDEIKKDPWRILNIESFIKNYN